MNALSAAWLEIRGLLVDDGFLATGIVLVVALASVAALLLQQPWLAGAVLIFGLLAALVASCLNAAKPG